MDDASGRTRLPDPPRVGGGSDSEHPVRTGDARAPARPLGLHRHGYSEPDHVRFFTRATIIEMFEGAGYRVVHCQGANSVWDTDWWRGP